MLLLLLVLLDLASCDSFVVENDTFLLNGKPFQFRSSSLHYFRMMRADWRDRMLRLKALGMNTLTCYVAWNVHQPVGPDEFDFSGERDVVAFLSLAHELGFYVLLRPGPYICAENEFGGLPAWLLKIPGLKVRTSFAPWNEAVDRYFRKLFSLLVPLSIQNGGPIIGIQVENEYGSAGNTVNNTLDRQYMHGLCDLIRSFFGADMFLFTTDPTHAIAAGSLYGYSNAVAILDFRPGANLTLIRQMEKQFNVPSRAPAAVTEWYPGWITAYNSTASNWSTTLVAVSEFLLFVSSMVCFV
jgi:hypothetical protein